ncbi:MAG: PaaI family thioesterase [Flavobacteriaceae bacterium]
MSHEIDKYILFHSKYGGTGKKFEFDFIDYKKNNLKLEGRFSRDMINPGPQGFVQGGQITSMLDDVTSLLLIFESKGEIYPSSTNLHTIFHRPINTGKYLCEATLISKGKNIATIKGEIYNHSGKVAATLIHNAFLISTKLNLNN